MDSSQHPRFRAWKGPRYEREGLNGVRLLILGESQYGGDPHVTEPVRGGPSAEDAASTATLVQKLGIDGPVKGRPFWTKVTKLVLGTKSDGVLSADARRDFWERVAFYNYIQWWMPGARYRPTPAMWAEAQAPFSQVVSELAPHLVLVLGLQLQRHLLPFTSSVVVIKHPSSVGFSYTLWGPQVQMAIEQARKEI